jgi:hypothetical protein
MGESKRSYVLVDKFDSANRGTFYMPIVFSPSQSEGMYTKRNLVNDHWWPYVYGYGNREDAQEIADRFMNGAERCGTAWDYDLGSYVAADTCYCGNCD